MGSALRRWWRYLAAWCGARLDAAADPKVLIGQARAEDAARHRRVIAQAAQVVATRNQIHTAIGRTGERIRDLQDQIRHALTLAATDADGHRWRRAADMLATELVALEHEHDHLTDMGVSADAAAAAAVQSVTESAHRTRQSDWEGTRLLMRLEQARLHEQVTAAADPGGDGAAPSMSAVADRIDRDHAVATARAQINALDVNTTLADLHTHVLHSRARERIAEISKSLPPGTGDDASP